MIKWYIHIDPSLLSSISLLQGILVLLVYFFSEKPWPAGWSEPIWRVTGQVNHVALRTLRNIKVCSSFVTDGLISVLFIRHVFVTTQSADGFVWSPSGSLSTFQSNESYRVPLVKKQGIYDNPVSQIFPVGRYAIPVVFLANEASSSSSVQISLSVSSFSMVILIVLK